MKYIAKQDASTHKYYGGTVMVTEFNFVDDTSMNDAKISLRGRYPDNGYAVNKVVTALVSVESGSGTLHFKASGSVILKSGDRVLIEPGDAYYFEPTDLLTIRYIASPAWNPEQAVVAE